MDRLQNRRAHHRRANHPHAGLTRRLRQAALKGVAPILVTNGDGGSDDGQVHFSALVRQGALVKGGKTRHGVPSFVGGGDFERLWDACSSTVRVSYLYNSYRIISLVSPCNTRACFRPYFVPAAGGCFADSKLLFCSPRYIKYHPNDALNDLKCKHGWHWKHRGNVPGWPYCTRTMHLADGPETAAVKTR